MKKVCSKVKEIMRSNVARFSALTGAVATAFTVGASAADPTPIAATDLQPVLGALTSQISVTTVIGIVAAGATAAVGFAFMWWGVRKLVRMLMAAFKRGKISV